LLQQIKTNISHFLNLYAAFRNEKVSIKLSVEFQLFCIFSIVFVFLSISEKREYAGATSNHWSSRNFSQQPYSSSLENLDPSAKEFLVDAGVTLDKSSILSTVSSSMPNLSKINGFLASRSESARGGNDSADSGGEGKKGNLEGEFSKYLISNEEMEQYEAEYQRCANALASGNSDPASLLAGNPFSGSGLLSRPKPEIHISPTRGRETSSLFTPSDKLISISSLAQVHFILFYFYVLL
jgi:hypothetical protein